MGLSIQLTAQASLDLFYQNYKSSSDFWTIEDFVIHCAGIVGNIYQQGYKEQYAEFRQEKRDEVISFDPATLNEQIVKVERKGSELVACLEHTVMSFPFDTQGVGLADIIPTRPLNGVILERTTSTALWQLKYVPYTNIIWWYLQRDKVKFINKGSCNLHEVTISYVPSINDPNFEVPDGIVEFVITTAAMTIKQGANAVVVKKSLDGNQNKIMQTEIDTSQLK